MLTLVPQTEEVTQPSVIQPTPEDAYAILELTIQDLSRVSGGTIQYLPL